MSTIVLRNVKGSPLTYEEADANFNNLNVDKLEASFETVSKNLRNQPFTIAYDAEQNLASIAYANGITKTFGYVDGTLTTITLGGAIPSGINTVKTLLYSGGNLAGATYA